MINIESIKALDIKITMLLNLDFTKNTIFYASFVNY